MTTTINADTVVGGAIVTGDASGELALQAAGVTKLTVNSSGVTLATPLPVASGGTGGSATATAGGVAYGTGTVQAYTSAGTAGQVLTSAGASAPTWASAASVNIQTFTSSGTWTKPSGANFVMVEVLGAGGGGGSGRRGATNTLRVGGAGGAGGAFMTKTFLASEIGSKVTVTIGAGGTGGVARSTDNTNGASGTGGGQSAFGNYLRVWGGTGGGAGGANTTVGGGGGATLDSNAPTNTIQGATVTTNIPGAFGRSFKPTTAQEWSGAGYGGGSGGFYNITADNNYGGESSVYGGGAGGSGGYIDTSNQIRLNSKGGGNYLAVGVSGYQISNSAKGVNGIPKWGGAGGAAFSNTATTAFNFDVAAFGNSTFVVANNTNADGYAIQASTDNGVTWTQYLIGIAIANLLWDGSKWVALSTENTIHTTTDFINWTTVGVCGDLAGGQYMNCLAYYNGTYVAVGVFGAIQTSTDLVAWTSQTSGIASISTNYIVKVIHDGTRWIAVGRFDASSTGIFLTSTDAVTWTNLSANLPATTMIYQIASSGSTYVIGVNDGAPKILYSTNGGTSWTASTATRWGAIATGAVYAGGNFVFANQNQIYYSTTGATFTLGYTAADVGTNTSYNCVASNGTTYIASFNYGVYAAVTSTNLTSWTQRSAGTGLPAVPGTGGNGGLAAGGGGGGASLNSYNSGGGGTGGDGLVRVYTW